MEKLLNEDKVALIFGGSGYIGTEVIASLSAAGMPIVFTYHSNKKQADKLRQQYQCSAYQLDLCDAKATRAFIDVLKRDGVFPNSVIHCAANSQNKAFLDIDDQDWEAILRLNCQSVFTVCQAMYRIAREFPDKLKNVIVLSAINQRQPFELPLHFAASQGAINQFVASASKNFGALGTCINVVVPGMLERGLSSHFSAELKQDFIQFSALGRLGNASEVARCIAWLATQNTYINGQCIPVNGGI